MPENNASLPITVVLVRIRAGGRDQPGFRLPAGALPNPPAGFGCRCWNGSQPHRFSNASRNTAEVLAAYRARLAVSTSLAQGQLEHRSIFTSADGLIVAPTHTDLFEAD